MFLLCSASGRSVLFQDGSDTIRQNNNKGSIESFRSILPLFIFFFVFEPFSKLMGLSTTGRRLMGNFTSILEIPVLIEGINDSFCMPQKSINHTSETVPELFYYIAWSSSVKWLKNSLKSISRIFACDSRATCLQNCSVIFPYTLFRTYSTHT